MRCPGLTTHRVERRTASPISTENRRNASRLGGFTLLEMVVAVSLLAVLILVVASTLWGAVRVERADAELLHRVTVQSSLADQFREDVAQAVACLDRIGDVAAGPHSLVLQMTSDRSVTFRWSNGRLMRTEVADSTQLETYFPVGGEEIGVEFVRPEPPGRVITMRLVDSRGAGESRKRWPVLISATLGGDRQ